ncbi:MAG: hypothetical protein JRJ31_18325, partial [Deltaproteobacteria bacterium]|nr:hypothetical protein [Deltaproteobacteria bacterium]
ILPEPSRSASPLVGQENRDASLSEEQVAIDPDGPANTWDLLLAVIPPADAVAGEEATITVSARSEGEASGTSTATVQIKPQS